MCGKALSRVKLDEMMSLHSLHASLTQIMSEMARSAICSSHRQVPTASLDSATCWSKLGYRFGRCFQFPDHFQNPDHCIICFTFYKRKIYLQLSNTFQNIIFLQVKTKSPKVTRFLINIGILMPSWGRKEPTLQKVGITMLLYHK